MDERYFEWLEAALDRIRGFPWDYRLSRKYLVYSLPLWNEEYLELRLAGDGTVTAAYTLRDTEVEARPGNRRLADAFRDLRRRYPDIGLDMASGDVEFTCAFSLDPEAGPEGAEEQLRRIEDMAWEVRDACGDALDGSVVDRAEELRCVLGLDGEADVEYAPVETLWGRLTLRTMEPEQGRLIFAYCSDSLPRACRRSLRVGLEQLRRRHPKLRLWLEENLIDGSLWDDACFHSRYEFPVDTAPEEQIRTALQDWKGEMEGLLEDVMGVLYPETGCAEGVHRALRKKGMEYRLSFAEEGPVFEAAVELPGDEEAPKETVSFCCEPDGVLSVWYRTPGNEDGEIPEKLAQLLNLRNKLDRFVKYFTDDYGGVVMAADFSVRCDSPDAMERDAARMIGGFLLILRREMPGIRALLD